MTTENEKAAAAMKITMEQAEQAAD